VSQHAADVSLMKLRYSYCLPKQYAVFLAIWRLRAHLTHDQTNCLAANRSFLTVIFVSEFSNNNNQFHFVTASSYNARSECHYGIVKADTRTLLVCRKHQTSATYIHIKLIYNEVGDVLVLLLTQKNWKCASTAIGCSVNSTSILQSNFSHLRRLICRDTFTPTRARIQSGDLNGLKSTNQLSLQVRCYWPTAEKFSLAFCSPWGII